MKLVYLKDHETLSGMILDCYDEAATIDTTDFANTYNCEIGVVNLPITLDELALCRFHRRIVNDVDNPTGIISVES